MHLLAYCTYLLYRILLVFACDAHMCTIHMCMRRWILFWRCTVQDNTVCRLYSTSTHILCIHVRTYCMSPLYAITYIQYILYVRTVSAFVSKLSASCNSHFVWFRWDLSCPRMTGRSSTQSSSSMSTTETSLTDLFVTGKPNAYICTCTQCVLCICAHPYVHTYVRTSIVDVLSVHTVCTYVCTSLYMQCMLYA